MTNHSYVHEIFTGGRWVRGSYRYPTRDEAKGACRMILDRCFSKETVVTRVGVVHLPPTHHFFHMTGTDELIPGVPSEPEYSI